MYESGKVLKTDINRNSFPDTYVNKQNCKT